MISEKTILVLGAGASMDYGFPSGKQLIEDIINFLHGHLVHENPDVNKLCVAIILLRYYSLKEPETDPANRKVLQMCSEQVTRFTNALISASPASIDDFIHKNRGEGFEIIGKLCIVIMISMYENEKEPFFIRKVSTPEEHRLYSRLLWYSTGATEHWEVRGGWYEHLWSKIYSDADIRNSLENLIVISFNYDRSFEQFLYSSCISMLGMPPDEVRDILNNALCIHHVYGQIGYLKWQKNEVVNPYNKVDVNALNELIYKNTKGHKTFMESCISQRHFEVCDHIIRIAKEIKTYTEATEDGEEVRKKVIQWGDTSRLRLFCLGFGYHPQNLQWLGNTLGETLLGIYGTTYGIGSAQFGKISSNLKQVLPKQRQGSEFSSRYSDMKIKDYLVNVIDI